MKNVIRILTVAIGLILFSCSPEDLTNGNDAKQSSEYSRTASTNYSNTWDFNNLTDWTDASQNGPGYYQIENGNLRIYTRSNSWDRSKVKTISSFTTGTYNWKVYVPEMGAGDMASIGAFLYSDDTHELDFEIGYGTQATRNELAAEIDDLVVNIASQANPSVSIRKKIKRQQWYILTLELSMDSKSRYVANWKINDSVVATAQLNYGNKSKFRIFCSVENLQFMGDHIPYTQNYALFDSVQFIQN